MLNAQQQAKISELTAAIKSEATRIAAYFNQLPGYTATIPTGDTLGDRRTTISISRGQFWASVEFWRDDGRYMGDRPVVMLRVQTARFPGSRRQTVNTTNAMPSSQKIERLIAHILAGYEKWKLHDTIVNQARSESEEGMARLKKALAAAGMKSETSGWITANTGNGTGTYALHYRGDGLTLSQVVAIETVLQSVRG